MFQQRWSTFIETTIYPLEGASTKPVHHSVPCVGAAPTFVDVMTHLLLTDAEGTICYLRDHLAYVSELL